MYIYIHIYICIRGRVCQKQGSTSKSSVEVADGSSEKRKAATLASTYRFISIYLSIYSSIYV